MAAAYTGCSVVLEGILLEDIWRIGDSGLELYYRKEKLLLLLAAAASVECSNLE